MPYKEFTNEPSSAYNLKVGFQSTNAASASLKLSVRFSKRTRIKLAIIAVFFVCIIVTSVLLWYFLRNDKKKQIAAFEEMENDMDKNADPCNDFYQFACGKYISRYMGNSLFSQVLEDKFRTLQKDNVLKAKSAISDMSKAKDPTFRKAHDYYSSCMNKKRTMNIFWNAAESVGGSELTSKGKFNLATWSFDDAILKLKRDYNVNPLFSVEIGNDLLNSSRNIFLIKPPDIALVTKLASEDHLMDSSPKFPGEVLEDDIEKIVSSTTNFDDRVRGVFINAVSSRTGRPMLSIASDISMATSFQSALIEDITSTMKGLVIHKIYKDVTVSQLYNITRNKVNWLKLLSGLAADVNSARVTNKTIVGLMVPTAYLDKVTGYLQTSYDRRRLPSFFAWTLLKKLSPVLPDAYFAAYYFQSPAKDIGTKGKERWRGCLLETQTRMPLTVGLMFTKNIVSEKKFNLTTNILKQVESAFKNGTASVPWLDAKTRSAVVEKVKYLVNIISNPKMISSDDLSKRYQDVKSQSDIGDFFLSCVRNIVRGNMKLRDQKPSRNRLDSPMKLDDVNAFYDRTRNRIMILAGILRQPFIYADGPSYINFGKIAAVVGHELLHGFDSLGWYFDKTGQIAPWWTQKAADAFQVRAKCIERQYSDYVSGYKSVDGKKTLAENIADNGGLKYAYEAYKSWTKGSGNEQKPAGLQKYSYDQLFFLAYGQLWCRAASDSIKATLVKLDTHSPNQYRVIGSVSNNVQFAKAYKCKAGTEMNPVSKCLLW